MALRRNKALLSTRPPLPSEIDCLPLAAGTVDTPDFYHVSVIGTLITLTTKHRSYQAFFVSPFVLCSFWT